MPYPQSPRTMTLSNVLFFWEMSMMNAQKLLLSAEAERTIFYCFFYFSGKNRRVIGSKQMVTNGGSTGKERFIREKGCPFSR